MSRTLLLIALALSSLGTAAQSADPATAQRMLAEALERVDSIDTDDLAEMLEDDPGLPLIDLRSDDEIRLLGGSIRARNHHQLTRGWLEFRIADRVPDKDTPLVVYCGTNRRSPLAAATLMDMGYTRVYNYADGFAAWKTAGLPIRQRDKAPGSMLYDLPRRVADRVYSAIGATQPPTYDNSGHNNNLSFVITDGGVLVVNAGDNYLLAKALHEEIKKLTDQPVRYVVLENGQGHAALGTSYWQEQGARVIAQQDAKREIDENGAQMLDRMRARNRDKALGTRVALPDETFTDQKIVEMGGERFELLDLGPAHSPGDIVVWLPQRKLVIAGDIAFHQRMLPVFEHTETRAWIETWDSFAALGAETVIPGHGEPTSMAEVTRYTRDYLVYMRDKVAEIIDQGGDLQQAYDIDQSPYADLDTFNYLARRNAGRIFQEMEFE